MKLASESKSTTGFAILLQGPPKSGKTTLALQFPSPYVADCEGNLDGPLHYIKSSDPAQYASIRLDHINTHDDGTLVADAERWTRMIACVNCAIKEPEVRTIVVDNAGSIGKYLEDYILSRKPSGHEKEKMTISDWIPWRNLMSKFVTDVRALMQNGRIFIMCSHEETVKDEVSGIIHYRTNIPSKLADNFGGLFSEVWRPEVTLKEGKRDYTINAMKETRQPQLGTSIGVPPAFKFSWSGFKKEYLDKYAR